MNDPLEKLEHELAAMRPCAVPKELERRIAIAMEANPRKWADRSLLSAMAMGAMAACVIVSVLVHGGAIGNGPPMPELNATRNGSNLVNYPLVMAGADFGALDNLK